MHAGSFFGVAGATHTRIRTTSKPAHLARLLGLLLPIFDRYCFCSLINASTMVVSAIVQYYKPASRGLLRRGTSAANVQQQQPSHQPHQEGQEPYHLQHGESNYHHRPYLSNANSRRSLRLNSMRNASARRVSASTKSITAVNDQEKQHAYGGRPSHRNHQSTSANSVVAEAEAKASTGGAAEAQQHQKRKKVKAISVLTSAAADFDVVADWLYYFQSIRQLDDDGNKLVPGYLLTILLASCLFGTLSWLILATDGRVVAPLFRALNIEGISIGWVLLGTVLVEDIPQVILTFLIDDYYDSDTVTSLAMFNLCTSLYDTLIKIAEAYDERNDIVETGAWCKETYRGHHGPVSAIVVLPISTAKCSESAASAAMQNANDANCTLGALNCMDGDMEAMEVQLNKNKASTMAKLISPNFLTASHDHTVRYWNPSAAQHRVRRNYIRKYKHKHKVTCVAMLAKAGYSPPTTIDEKTARNRSDSSVISTMSSNTANTISEEDDDTENTESVYFVTGSKDGLLRLFQISNKECIRTYVSDSPVTCVASLDKIAGTQFISGHKDAQARLWDTATGANIRVFNGHLQPINSVCCFKDESLFLSTSDDSTIKVWDVTSTKRHPLSPGSGSQVSFDFEGSHSSIQNVGSFGESKHCSGLVAWDIKAPDNGGVQIRQQVVAEEREYLRSFSGHRGQVLCVSTFEEGAIFISGGNDSIVMLWEFKSGGCIQNFVGHSGPVSSVCIFDESTILSGSHDRTARMWDVDTGVCLRVFQHHKADIMGIVSCGNGRTFLTTSRDSTIKLWTANAVSSMQENTDGSDVEMQEY